MHWLWPKINPPPHHIEASIPPKPSQKHQIDSAELWELFARFDTDHSGTIDKQELKSAMRSMGLQVDGEANKLEFERMFKEIDRDNNGKIDFEEFLFLATEQLGARQDSEYVFHRLRQANQEMIEHEDLRRAAIGYKIPLSEKDIDDMIKYFAKKNANGIDKEDFYELFKQINSH